MPSGAHRSPRRRAEKHELNDEAPRPACIRDVLTHLVLLAFSPLHAGAASFVGGVAAV
jgi:hypothetical protein